MVSSAVGHLGHLGYVHRPQTQNLFFACVAYFKLGTKRNQLPDLSLSYFLCFIMRQTVANLQNQWQSYHMTPEERSALAAQMIDNPVWDESFSIIRDAYLAKLLALGPEHDIERYKYCEALRQIDFVKLQVERTFEIGSALAKEIADADNVLDYVPNYAKGVS